MKTLNRRLLVTVSLLLSLVVALTAQTDVYAQSIFEYYNTGDNNASWEFSGSSWRGQTFTVGSEPHTVTSVKLKLYRGPSTTPETITVSLRATDGSGKPVGADLTSGTYDGNALLPSPLGTWVEFSVTEYTLLADMEYAICIRAEEDSVYARLASPGAYAAGRYIASLDGGSTWSVEDADLMFEIWGNPYFITTTVTATETETVTSTTTETEASPTTVTTTETITELSTVTVSSVTTSVSTVTSPTAIFSTTTVPTTVTSTATVPGATSTTTATVTSTRTTTQFSTSTLSTGTVTTTVTQPITLSTYTTTHYTSTRTTITTTRPTTTITATTTYSTTITGPASTTLTTTQTITTSSPTATTTVTGTATTATAEAGMGIGFAFMALAIGLGVAGAGIGIAFAFSRPPAPPTPLVTGPLPPQFFAPTWPTTGARAPSPAEHLRRQRGY